MLSMDPKSRFIEPEHSCASYWGKSYASYSYWVTKQKTSKLCFTKDMYTHWPRYNSTPAHSCFYQISPSVGSTTMHKIIQIRVKSFILAIRGVAGVRQVSREWAELFWADNVVQYQSLTQMATRAARLVGFLSSQPRTGI